MHYTCALYPYFTVVTYIFMLHFFQITLFSRCTFFILHYFHVALFCVVIFLCCTFFCVALSLSHIALLHVAMFSLYILLNYIHALFSGVYTVLPQTSKMESFATIINKAAKSCCKLSVRGTHYYFHVAFLPCCSFFM